MNAYSYLDIGLTIIITATVFRGFSHGFVKEFFTLGALAFGVLAGFLFYTTLAEVIRTNYMPDIKGVPEVLAFIILFAGVYIICKLLQKIFHDVINGLNLTGLDKLLGGVIGFAEGLVFVSALLLLVSIQPVFDTSEMSELSFFGRILLPVIIGIPEEGLDFLNIVIYQHSFFRMSCV